MNHSKNLDQLIKIMNIKYAPFLQDRIFSFEVEEQKEHLVLRVILANSQKTFYYPVEASIRQSDLKDAEEKSVLLVVDYIDLYFSEFLESEESVFLNIDWQVHQYEGLSFSLRGQIQNLYQELKADEILHNSLHQ